MPNDEDLLRALHDDELRVAAWRMVLDERIRQEALIASGKFPYSNRELSTLDPASALAVLVEEVGEVARVLNDAREGITIGFVRDTRDEVTQVAAVALAWLEGLIEWEREVGPRIAPTDSVEVETSPIIEVLHETAITEVLQDLWDETHHDETKGDFIEHARPILEAWHG